MSETFTITKARYAKQSIAVRCQSDGSGFMTREMRVVEALNGRWSNREKAYVLAATKEARLRRLIADGYDARLKPTGVGYKTKMMLEGPQ